MTVKDILPDRPLDCITVRTNSPFEDEPDGMLFGCCAWDGENLISLDGDNYYLGDEVSRYEWSDDGSLTYWFQSDWRIDIIR